MKYDIILFDLDGTLTDPQEGIINSILYALGKMKIPVADRAVLRSFIGPPLLASFQNYFAMDEAQARNALDLYREYFKDKGIFENLVYPGVPDLLSELKAAGKKVILATSKPTVFADEILQHFQIRPYFDLVVGSNLDNTRMKKGEVIGYILETLQRARAPFKRDAIVMVGDREHDIIGAREHQLDAIGVTFGYGTAEELSQAGAKFIVGSIPVLQNVLLS